MISRYRTRVEELKRWLIGLSKEIATLEWGYDDSSDEVMFITRR